MEADTQSATTKKPFDFGAAMSKLPSSSVQLPPDEIAPPAPEELPPAAVTDVASAPEEPKPIEEDDDLVVGDQLDEVSAQMAATQPADGGQSASVDAVAATASHASAATTTAPAEDTEVPAESTSEETLQNPNDPRMAALMNAGRQEAEQRAHERTASQQGRGGSAPGISGAIGAGLMVLGKAATGGFKMIGNGLPPYGEPDLSRPKAMGIAEKRAVRAGRADEFYSTAKESVIREKIYRDLHESVTSALSDAQKAQRDFEVGVQDFHDVLDRSPVKALADAAQTSVGDYIHGVKSGTIKDAAGQAVVQTLEQSPEFKASEGSLLASANEFKAKSDVALKKMDSIDTAFPDRMNTSLRKQQLAEMAEGMQDDQVAKASQKLKSFMDELDRLAKAIKDAITSAINKVASAFKPK